MRGVGRNQFSHAAVLDDIAWLRENGYRHATNRQLAERLGITLKALEHHLYDARYRVARERGWSEREIEERTGIAKATDRSRYAQPEPEEAA